MKRLLTLVLITLVLASVATGAIYAWQWNKTQDATYLTDAQTIRTPLRSAPVREILWQPAERLAGVLGTDGDDYEPRISADGQTLFFVRGRAGENADIYLSRRLLDGWTDPQPLSVVNTDADELGPQPNRDGSEVYFYSNRDGGHGGYDLWVARRDGSGSWNAPVNLGERVNTRFNDYGPALTPDGKILYFASNRPRTTDPEPDSIDSWPATLREDFERRTYDLYASVIGERGLSEAAAVDALNTEHNEGAPAVSPVGDFLYFASDRPGGLGGFDLYRSRLLRGAHEPAHSLGSAVNSPSNELDPALGMGGFELIFSSNREQADQGTPAEDEGAGVIADGTIERDYDLYRTTRREVFREVDTAQASFDWGTFWDTLWPLLLLLLLLLALLALLRRLWKSERMRLAYRRLSLLAKCVLASILLHVLLAMLFAIWTVGTQLGELFKESSGTKVALITRAGDGVAAQVRGGLTEVEIETQDPIETLRSVAQRLETPRPAAAVVSVPRAEIQDQMQDSPRPVIESLAELPAPESSEVDPSRTEAEVLTPAEAQRERAEEAEQAAEVAQARNTARPKTDVRPAESSRVDVETAARSELTEASMAEAAAADARPDAESVPDRARVEVTEAPPAEASLPAAQTGERAAESTMAVREDRSASARPSELAAEQASSDSARIEPDQTEIVERGTLASAEPIESSAPALAPSRRGGPRVDSAQSPQAARLEENRSETAEESGLSVESERPASARSSNETVTVAEAAPALARIEPERSGATPEASLAESSEMDGAPSAGADVKPLRLELPAEIASAQATDVALPSEQGATGEQESAQNPTALAARRSPSARSERALLDQPSRAQRAEVDVASSAPAGERSMANTAASFDALPSEDAAVPVGVLATEFDPVGEVELLLPDDLASAEAATSEASGELSGEVSGESSGETRGSTPSARAQRALLESPTSDVRVEVVPDRVTVADGLAIPLPAASAAPGASDLPIPLSSDIAPELALGAPALALDLPMETVVPEGIYPQRAPDARRDLVERMGGSEQTEASVALALEWLARHQQPDGSWTGRDFPHADEQGGEAQFDFDYALTGLALMAFLGADHTHMEDGPYRDVVERGVRWLVEHQGEDGDLRLGETMYSQGIATIALAEAHAMTGDPTLVDPVRRAVAYIEGARNDDEGGWRYEAGQPGDTSVLGWQVMALTSAKRAGIFVDPQNFENADEFLDDVAHPIDEGLYAYQAGMEPAVPMTAEAMFIRQLLGDPIRSARMRQSADYIAEELPDWDEDANTYSWYYTTLALYQYGGNHWERWNAALVPELLASQRTDGRATGSWDPEDRWSNIGGRVYQTAICALTLEVYYRYLPTFVGDADGASGVISGIVTDGETGEALPGASIRLDLPDGESLIARAGPRGQYTINAPELPEFIAVTASARGYTPDSLNIAADDVEGRVLDRDFALRPARGDVVAIEEDPEVRHLGNGDFSGRINSQFQKETEGLVYEATFYLSRAQLEGARRAELRIMQKGTQADNPVTINGWSLDPLNEAPRDGSFEEYVSRVPMEALRVGENRLRIRSVRGNSDLDDFEFVNPRLQLRGGGAIVDD